MHTTRHPILVKGMAALLIFWALLLHGFVISSAGALWRDEANSVSQAGLSSWPALWESLQYDSFPALYPALLKTVFHGHLADDRLLRAFGAATGLALLASIFFTGRLLGSRFPITLLALLAIDPLVVSEGDSIRPYGLGLLCLVWCFCAYGKLLMSPSKRWWAAAAVTSLLVVQTSYTGAVFVGVLGFSAALSAPRRIKTIGLALLPGILAAASLLAYVRPLRQAGSWVSVLHYSVDWSGFLAGYFRDHTILPALAWAAVTAVGIYGLLCYLRRDEAGSPVRSLEPQAGKRSLISGLLSIRSISAPSHTLIRYGLLAAVLGAGAQLFLMQAMGISPFPRYFLPVLVLAAFALEMLTRELKVPVRAAAALAVLLLTAWPSWSWVRMSHTNMDKVAGVLNAQVKPADLVVVTPWFLHPSFQRYYHGPARWVTVPMLSRQPLTRYDLVKEAMLDPQREQRLWESIRQALLGGGSVWLVSQIAPAREETPVAKVPVPSERLNGTDYARFRNYWEKMIIYRLYGCSLPVLRILPPAGGVWNEERLFLSSWTSHK